MVERNLVNIDGRLGTSGSERFSIGLHYYLQGGGAVAGPSDLQTWANSIAALWGSAGLGSLKAALGTSSAVTGVRVYAYGATGPALLQASTPVTTAGAGTGSPLHPFQIARAVTLQTGLASRRARGRFYWPAITHTVDPATGKATPPTGFGEACVALVSGIALSAPSAFDVRPAVYSATANAVTEVTSCRVGDVLDTQRRRRDNLPEAYTVFPL